MDSAVVNRQQMLLCIGGKFLSSILDVSVLFSRYWSPQIILQQRLIILGRIGGNKAPRVRFLQLCAFEVLPMDSYLVTCLLMR